MKRSAVFFASLTLCLPTLSMAAGEDNPKPVTVENEPTVQVGNTVGVNVENVPTVDVGNVVGVDVLTMPEAPEVGIDSFDSPRLIQIGASCSAGDGGFGCVKRVSPTVNGKVVDILLTVDDFSGSTFSYCTASASLIAGPTVGVSGNTVQLGQVSQVGSTPPMPEATVSIPLAVPVSLEPDDFLELFVDGGRCRGHAYAHLVVE